VCGDVAQAYGVGYDHQRRVRVPGGQEHGIVNHEQAFESMHRTILANYALPRIARHARRLDQVDDVNELRPTTPVVA